MQNSESNTGEQATYSFHLRLTRRHLTTGGLALLLCVITITAGYIFAPRKTDPNPFSTKVMASIKLPLYYPTDIPKGFQMDPKTVTQPVPNVVVVTMIGPMGSKLYLSEQPRPATFNLGGFYTKLRNLQEIGVPGGAVAAGYDGATLVASRSIDNTWLISNTNASLTENDLIVMLKSLKAAQ